VPGVICSVNIRNGEAGGPPPGPLPTPDCSWAQRSRPGHTSTTSRPAFAATAHIRPVVASRTVWPAACAAQTNGTTGIISP
jgi:hypothetical protein